MISRDMYEFGKRLLQRLFHSQEHKRRLTWKRVINAERGITVVIKLGPLMAGHARQRNTITYVLLVYGRRGKQETWHTRLDGISNPLASYYIDLGAPSFCFHQTLHNSSKHLGDYLGK